MSTSEAQTTDLKLEIKDVADFDIDRGDELCIGIDHKDGYICTWLNREEGAQLMDLLKRWLS